MLRSDKNAMLVKSYNFRYKDYKTINQWFNLGYLVKSNAKGVLLYTNGTCKCKRMYYSIDEVYKK